jgi:hypothetical protein
MMSSAFEAQGAELEALRDRTGHFVTVRTALAWGSVARPRTRLDNAKALLDHFVVAAAGLNSPTNFLIKMSRVSHSLV